VGVGGVAEPSFTAILLLPLMGNMICGLCLKAVLQGVVCYCLWLPRMTKEKWLTKLQECIKYLAI